MALRDSFTIGLILKNNENEIADIWGYNNMKEYYGKKHKHWGIRQFKS